MLSNYNYWHPLPRYGLAAAIFEWQLRNERRSEIPNMDEAALAQLAVQALNWVKPGFLLEAKPSSAPDEAEKAIYELFNHAERLNPGSKSGQNAANGFFLAPHVLTSNNSGMMVKEFGALQKALAGKPDKSFQLKRSFSPQTSKINAGTRSMSDPKDSVLVAAFTAIGAATKNKAAALNYDTFTNVGLIPDIPLIAEDGRSYPLIAYLKMLYRVQQNLGDAYVGKYDPVKQKFIGRPPLYRGNFKRALSNVDFGSLQLLAAFSGMIEEGEEIDPAEVSALVQTMANRPMMIVGYDYNGQEQFGSHLVKMTEDGSLYRMLNDIWKVELVGVENGKKYSSRPWGDLRRHLDRWLRRYDPPSFRGLLSVRANYPENFLPPIHKYFLMQGIPKDIVDSAMAMGKSLNRAAFLAAKDKHDSDKGATTRDLYEYKSRVLSSLEGNIRSAKGGAQLLSQVSTLVGRMTNYDLSSESARFMVAVSTKELDYKVAQDLLIAFMRLNQTAKKTTNEDLESEAVSDQRSVID